MNIKRVLLTLGVLLVVLAAGGFAWLWFAPCWLGGCAPVDEMMAFQAEGSQLLDREGEQFGTLATVNRRIVPLDSLPEHVPQAFVAVEDQRFFEHSGVDFQRVLGALASNVEAGGVAEGGSTITMQLARNLFPDWLPYTERSIRRKLMEVRVARQIERSFSKEKILELYLNHIYMGEGAYGVGAASQTYFGKPAAELSIAEAALLGGLPKAPSEINPVANRQRARERRNLVLEEMAQAGYISRAQAAEAQQEEIRLAEGGAKREGIEGSYFIERVRREMQDLIGSRFYTAGLKIYTTMDSEAQRAAEEELAKQLDAIEAGKFGTYRHETYPEAKGTSAESGTTPYLQGMVLVMDASTGAVRALVGGRDFDDSKFDRAVQAQRQPGSAFKPFVYLTALESFRSPVHVVEDAPVRLTLSDGKVWEPKNYTGRYDGPMTLREALTRSKNTVTVRLAQEVGMEPVIRNAHTLGISTDIPNYPSAALGAATVRPIQLVAAYAAFANGGMRVEPHVIERVEDRSGRVIWEAPRQAVRVLDPAVAFVLTSILQDVVDKGTGSAVRAVGFQGPAAGKTGTTNDAADVWFLGYTPELVGGVWIGMDDPQPIVRGASGGTLAAPVWGRVMRRVYQDRPTPSGWSPPPGVVEAEVERETGRVVSEFCPARGPTYTEYFVSAPPRESCVQESPYPSLAASDTAWWDEEWSADDFQPPPLDDPSGGSTAGVDWPELEEVRRTGRAEDGGSAGEGRSATIPDAPTRPQTAPQPEPSRDLPGQSSNRREPRPATPGRNNPPPAEPQQEPDEGPRLLGVPVRPGEPRPSPRDTAAAQ